MEERTKFHVGLDVHKDSISVAAAELGRAPARSVGKVTHDLNKLPKVLNKIGTAKQLHIVYEAGPTGFGLQRALKERGYVCEVIAPSQIPRRPGDRVKTDGRDCIQLAECSRAGQLSAVWIPDPGDCAMTSATPARARGALPLARQEALPESIRSTVWKAQLRLTQRFAALRNRGVRINKACVAVARELAASSGPSACRYDARRNRTA